KQHRRDGQNFTEDGHSEVPLIPRNRGAGAHVLQARILWFFPKTSIGQIIPVYRILGPASVGVRMDRQQSYRCPKIFLPAPWFLRGPNPVLRIAFSGQVPGPEQPRFYVWRRDGFRGVFFATREAFFGK